MNASVGERSLWSADAFALIDDGQGGARHFTDRLAAIEAWTPDAVPNAFAAVDDALARGYHLAGFLSYELGYVLEPKLSVLLPARRDTPLLSFGVFSAPRVLDSQAVSVFLASAPREAAPRRAPSALNDGLPAPALDARGYAKRFAMVKDLILAGDIYQANLTFPTSFAVGDAPKALYAELRRTQRTRNGALLCLSDRQILSLSPELFIESDGTLIRTRPMKGTAKRAPIPAEDEAARRALQQDPKARAENLMIVDLLRNDLGRVAETGSVLVERLYEIETYRTLHQMTSTIRATLAPDCGFGAIMHALFPCGSVTGAPKIRAMEIIRTLEDGPRGVYCGAIGWIAPPRDDANAKFGSLRFNVAIRTLTLDESGQARLDIGSGLVADSDCDAEYQECLLKARFAATSSEPFALFETILWHPEDGFILYTEHIERLTASAAYFGFSCDGPGIAARLAEAAASFDARPQRVRLTLAEDGKVGVEATPTDLAGDQAPWRVAISPRSVDSTDPFLYHKTTRRQFYERERARMAEATGASETLFINERGELTEGSFTNIFVKRGSLLLTPPVTCGLLAGTLRGRLLADPDRRCVEQILRPDTLGTADQVFIGNSVRGLIPVELVATKGARTGTT